MNTTSRTSRVAAAIASIAITFSLVSGVADLAQPPLASSLLVQADTTVAAR